MKATQHPAEAPPAEETDWITVKEATARLAYGTTNGVLSAAKRGTIRRGPPDPTQGKPGRYGPGFLVSASDVETLRKRRSAAIARQMRRLRTGAGGAR